MKIIQFVSALLLVAAVASPPALRAQDILVNSGFEADNASLDPGNNNVGAVPTGWNVSGGAGNLDTGAGAIAPYDGPYSGGSDGSTGGTTIFDGTNSFQADSGVTLSQTFTLATAADLGGTFAIGDRDGGGLTAYAHFSITNSNNVEIFGFDGNAPNYNSWTTYNFDAGVIPAGTYTASFDLPDTDNVDAVAFGIGVGGAVPEPSAWAMMALGAGVLFVGARHYRRPPVATA